MGAFSCKVLKNGVEVKLQRNALSVLEHPTGNEDDGDHNMDSSTDSDIIEKENIICQSNLGPIFLYFIGILCSIF